MQAMDISLTALDVEWRRLEIISSNIANADGGLSVGAPVRRLVSGPRASFASYLEPAAAGSMPVQLQSLNGVAVYGVENADTPQMQQNTNAQDVAPAEAGRFDHAEQMTLMIKTARAYEANIVAMNTARQMYSKALELGRRG